MFGVNAAGLGSKMDSFVKCLKDLSPQIFFVQEVKNGSLQHEFMKNFQLYQLKRQTSRISLRQSTMRNPWVGWGWGGVG